MGCVLRRHPGPAWHVPGGGGPPSMRTRLSLLLASLIVLSSLPAMTVQAAGTCPSGTVTGIESPTTFSDGCYHQYLLYNVDTPEVDAIILPPATANNAVRDITLIEQSIDA